MRIEIKIALEKPIPAVVPVFLGDAPIPASVDLPKSVRPLLGLHATRLQLQSLNKDTEKLLSEVARSIDLTRKSNKPTHQPVVPKKNWLQEMNTLIAKSKDQPRASIEIHRNLIEQIKIFAILQMSDGDWIAAALNKAFRSKIYTADHVSGRLCCELMGE